MLTKTTRTPRTIGISVTTGDLIINRGEGTTFTILGITMRRSHMETYITRYSALNISSHSVMYGNIRYTIGMVIYLAQDLLSAPRRACVLEEVGSSTVPQLRKLLHTAKRQALHADQQVDNDLQHLRAIISWHCPCISPSLRADGRRNSSPLDTRTSVAIFGHASVIENSSITATAYAVLSALLSTNRKK